MSTAYPDLFAALAAPFGPNEAKVFSKSGKQIHYITARTVMNRLDAVLGPENWWARFEVASADSVACYLTVLLPDGRELTKSDLGGAAGMADAGDDDKSAASDALKRAGVHFGVARYLYRDGVPTFVQVATTEGVPSPVSTPCPDTRPAGKGPLTQPTAPAPADLGWVHNAPAAPAPAIAQNGAQSAGANGKAPRDGKRLFGWCKDMEEKHDVGLIKYLNGFGRLQDWPGRMVEWDAEMVKQAYAEALRKLEALQPAGVAS